MNKRFLSFLFSIIILMATLTGCMQYKITINMDDNNVNKIIFDMAYNEAVYSKLDAEGQNQLDLMDELVKDQLMGTSLPGIQAVNSPLSYVDKGFAFKGTRYEFTIDNTDYTELNREPLKIIPLSKNRFRIEMDFVSSEQQKNEQEEFEKSLKEIGMTVEDYKEFLSETGAKSSWLQRSK